MKAIVYTSNSGYTAEYANMLAEATGLPAYACKDCAQVVEKGADVIYLGWLMAGSVRGYKKAAANYRIRAVCGVGMGAAGSQLEEIRKGNQLPDTMPLFTLQGGFDMTKLHGVYKLMMQFMKRTVGKTVAEKKEKTPEEADMLDLLQNGGSRVSKEQLAPVLDWYREQK